MRYIYSTFRCFLSIVNYTHIFTKRIQRLLPARTVKVLDVNTETVESLAKVLVTECSSLAIGVHAYRSGRLLLDCGVPFIIILGGTNRLNIFTNRNANVNDNNDVVNNRACPAFPSVTNNKSA